MPQSKPRKISLQIPQFKLPLQSLRHCSTPSGQENQRGGYSREFRDERIDNQRIAEYLESSINTFAKELSNIFGLSKDRLANIVKSELCSDDSEMAKSLVYFEEHKKAHENDDYLLNVLVSMENSFIDENCELPLTMKMLLTYLNRRAMNDLEKAHKNQKINIANQLRNDIKNNGGAKARDWVLRLQNINVQEVFTGHFC